jgi:L,D-transpeptidase ErfK/SrfK
MSIIISIVLGIFLYLFSGPLLYAKSFGARLCQDDPRYFCYTVKKGDTWQKLFTDPDQQDIVMRVNRVNIQLQRGSTIAIPKNLNFSDALDYSPFSKQIEPPGAKTILVSLNENKLAWGAYDEAGNLEKWGPVSGGKGWCPDVKRSCNTATGKFTIHRTHGARCVSSKFPIPKGGAPMPYCMFFHGGFALHGSYEVPGYNASHGCVRMYINDAKWLNEEFVNGENVTVVISR